MKYSVIIKSVQLMTNTAMPVSTPKWAVAVAAISAIFLAMCLAIFLAVAAVVVAEGPSEVRIYAIT